MSRRLAFGRLTMQGKPLDGGGWVLTEAQDGKVTTFLVLNDMEAADLRNQINEKLGPWEVPGGVGDDTVH